VIAEIELKQDVLRSQLCRMEMPSADQIARPTQAVSGEDAAMLGPCAGRYGQSCRF
jgi:hypothetical protein